jgi:hypothetical protein
VTFGREGETVVVEGGGLGLRSLGALLRPKVIWILWLRFLRKMPAGRPALLGLMMHGDIGRN